MRAMLDTTDFCRFALKMFLLLRNLRYKMIPYTKLQPEQIADIMLTNGVKEREKNISDDWSPEGYYELSKLGYRSLLSNSVDERKLFPCKRSQKKKDISYIAADKENFIFVEPDMTKIYWAKIIVNTRFKNVEAIVDRSDPRKLIIGIKSRQRHHRGNTDSTEDYTLYFEDHTIALAAK